MTSPVDPLEEFADIVSDESDSDIYYYNGGINRGADLKFIQCVHQSKKKDNATLVLTTLGGSPDAAYKIARYMQTRYDTFTVLVSGECKSAGTLIAVGAHSIAFAPYGELGPIDIQSYKTDHLAERQSGLTITESLQHLTTSAIRTHAETFSAMMRETGMVISFKTAAQAASELVSGIFTPIFSQIDPMEVGEKARSMRIASDYGRRLNARSDNLKDNALKNLTETYPSHSFVIDIQEARGLFKDIRPLSENEQKLVETLGLLARIDYPREDDEPNFACLSGTTQRRDENEEPINGKGGTSEDRENPPAAVEASDDSPQNNSELRNNK